MADGVNITVEARGPEAPPPSTRASVSPSGNAGDTEAGVATAASLMPAHAREALLLLAGREAHRVLSQKVEEINRLLGKKEAANLRGVLAKRLEQARERANQLDKTIEEMVAEGQPPERQALGYEMKLGFLNLDLAQIEGEITELEGKTDKTEQENKKLDFLKRVKEELTKGKEELGKKRKEIKTADGREIPSQLTPLAEAVKGGELTEEEKKNPLTVLQEKIGEAMVDEGKMNELCRNLVSKGILTQEQVEGFKKEFQLSQEEKKGLGERIKEKAVPVTLGIIGLLVLLAYAASKKGRGEGG